MDNMKKWLVPLNLDENDRSLLAYTAFIAKQIEPEAITFLHVQEADRQPLGFGHHIPQANSCDAEERKMAMQVAAYQHFPSDMEMNFETVNGKSVHAVLQATVDTEAGLTFLSWNPEKKSSQTLARKVTRKTSSSVWVVPTGFEPRLQTALLPIDFSIYSHRALSIAMDLVQGGALRSVYCQHVYLGATYYESKLVSTLDEAHSTSRRMDQREQDLKKYFEDELCDYLAPFDLNSRFCLRQVDSLDHTRESVYDKIKDFQETLDPDLLIMGSRGLTGVNSVMLGGVTDHVMREFSKTPFLCLKRPVENRDLLDVLLKR